MASLATTIRTARVTLIGDAIDAGASAGELRVYAGAPPANAGAALGGATLLVTIDFEDPAFSDVTAGVATIDAPLGPFTITASGTATFARAMDSDGTVVAQFTAGGVGNEVAFDTAGLVQGGTVTVDSGTITEGNA